MVAVAVERLAGYMAQIDAAMESMKEKRVAAKETCGRKASGSVITYVSEARGEQDNERKHREQSGSVDEVERLRSHSLPIEDILERKEIREALDTLPRRPRRKTTIDPTDEVVVGRLSKDSDFDSTQLDKVPSSVEFPTCFKHDDNDKDARVDSVLKKLQIFCLDIYCTGSVLEHVGPQRLEHSMGLDY